MRSLRTRPHQTGRRIAREGVHARVAGEVRKVVVGQDEALEACSRRWRSAATCCSKASRRGQDAAGQRDGAALGLEFRRAQFTPDMLPSDVTGTMALRAGELVFRPGPVFASVVLADEINRTPPKTQAALLEAMQEGQVTVDGGPRPARPVPGLATQNPIEYEGTYPLPEAQRDRFLVQVAIGYPEPRRSARCSACAPRARARRPRRRAAGGERRGSGAARAEVDATEVARGGRRYVVASSAAPGLAVA